MKCLTNALCHVVSYFAARLIESEDAVGGSCISRGRDEGMYKILVGKSG
jgi:hypothetical protein